MVSLPNHKESKQNLLCAFLSSHSLGSTQFFSFFYLFNLHYELSWNSGIVLGDRRIWSLLRLLKINGEIVKMFKHMIFALMMEILFF